MRRFLIAALVVVSTIGVDCAGQSIPPPSETLSDHAVFQAAMDVLHRRLRAWHAAIDALGEAVAELEEAKTKDAHNRAGPRETRIPVSVFQAAMDVLHRRLRVWHAAIDALGEAVAELEEAKTKAAHNRAGPRETRILIEGPWENVQTATRKTLAASSRVVGAHALCVFVAGIVFDFDDAPVHRTKSVEFAKEIFIFAARSDDLPLVGFANALMEIDNEIAEAARDASVHLDDDSAHHAVVEVAVELAKGMIDEAAKSALVIVDAIAADRRDGRRKRWKVDARGGRVGEGYRIGSH